MGGLARRPYGTGGTLWHSLWHTRLHVPVVRVPAHCLCQAYGETAIMTKTVEGKCVIVIRTEVGANVLIHNGVHVLIIL